jgi:hypothetical protein
MLIGPPWKCCPECGNEELGTVDISEYTIHRRCRDCLHTPPSETLPPVPKKVVYLDQLVYSEIAKALDPIWREERPVDRDRWLRIFDALDRALKLQLIVCPESQIHEQESVVHEHEIVLRRLYQHFAAGTSFEFPTRVHAIQLSKALRVKLEGRDVDYDDIDRREVVRGSLDGWIPRVQLHVDFAGYPDPALLSRAADDSGQAFAAIFKRWAREKPSFDEVYQLERLGHALTILLRLREYAEAIRAVQDGTAPVSEVIWNPHLEVDAALCLIALAESHGMGRAQAEAYVCDFLASEEALSAPSNEISSYLMAGLARRAATGQRRPPSRGMWNDITVISAFLPYCDAMFLDRECASLLREEPLRSWIARYSVPIFTAATGGEFVAYLEKLEEQAGPEHASLVREVYGEEWLTPFRTMLEHERQRARD